MGICIRDFEQNEIRSDQSPMPVIVRFHRAIMRLIVPIEQGHKVE
jgi:hypothetical protein